jgi:acyl transferase domain-containing protein/phosphopantetheinyl transferase
MSDGCKDIAIIGMACIFPGAGDLHRYWENILAKVDAVSDAPEDWESAFYYDPESGSNDRTYCRRGGFLGDLAAFDPAQYGVMPNAVDGTEPDHFLALRVAYDALVHAGYKDPGKYRETTEVIVGRGTYVNRGNTTALQHSMVVDSVIRVLRQLHPEHTDEELASVRAALKQSLPPFHADTAPGLVPNIISGRIANRLDCMGANYIVDAACASSLVAVDHAVRDLQSGRCDMAVAGGVNASVPPTILVIFSQLNALSRTGRIRPFDSAADGTLLGEGAGMVVLKRLADAERDGDRIWAVIKGAGVASDGRAIGLLAPRLEGEELALRRAYTAAGVEPRTVGLIEAHGTATLVGDAVEINALTRVFGESGAPPQRCAIGSVKSMISHTMPASGIAGLIKTALALHHKVLPPTLHCDTPSQKLDLAKTPFYVNAEMRPWIHGDAETPRRAGVNAFGFGGINAHTVLEEYTGESRPASLQREWSHEMFVVSAANPEALPDAISDSIAFVRGLAESTPLRNIAWTLNCEQEVKPSRLSVVAGSRAELIAKLERAAAKLARPDLRRIRDPEGIYYYREPLGRTGKLAFLFPGEGGQYQGMLSDLCVHFSEAREWFDLMDEALEGRGYRLSETIFPVPGASAERLFAMDIGAEAVFCANQALFAVLNRLGIRPGAMAGHSTGEHSALINSGLVAGADKDELLRHIRGVNNVFQRLSASAGIEEGVLLAIAGADRKLLDKLISEIEGLYVALDNCPNQIVLFGKPDRIEKLTTALARTPAICQPLEFSRAYHTPFFHRFSVELRAHFDAVRIGTPAVPVYSCVSAGVFPVEADAVRELASVVWERTVRFRETVQAMYDDGFRVFVEAGPRGNLTAFLGDIFRGKTVCAIPADLQHRSSIEQLQHLAAELTANDVEFGLKQFYEHREAEPVHTPAAPTRRAAKLSMGLQPLRLPDGFRLPSRPAMAAPEPQSASPRSSLMTQHLSVMEQFLRTQQTVLGSFLASRSQPKGAVLPPFLTAVEEIQPGASVRVLARLNLSDYPLLLDHTLGRDVSASEAGRHGLPVVPLTMTMELLAEAAALLAPGMVLVRMRDLRATQWLALESGELTLELTATFRPDGNIHVALRRRTPDTANPVCAEAAMMFAPRYPDPPALSIGSPHDAQPSAWTRGRLYTEGMFHGPSFRAVEEMNMCGPTGSLAKLRCPSRNALVRSTSAPAFLTDFVALDAAGQAVAFWSQEKLQPCGDIFPYSLDSIECYGPPPEPGEPLECRTTSHGITSSDLHSDIEIADSRGRVIYKLTNWADRRFLVPSSLWALRIAPRSTYTGAEWKEPVRGAEGIATCSRVDLPESLLMASHGIWSKTLAHIVLSRQELAEWYRLPAAGKRRNEWLLGRCAAKDAIRLLLRQKLELQVPAADVIIGSGPDGEPLVSGPWAERAGFRPSVSISHSNSAAVAIAIAEPGLHVGVDLEFLSRRADDYVSIAFSEAERGVVEHSTPAGRREEWYLRAWCAKESITKALGCGLGEGLRSAVIGALSVDTGIVELKLKNGLAARYASLAGRSIPVQTVRLEDWICSAAIVEAEASAAAAAAGRLTSANR